MAILPSLVKKERRAQSLWSFLRKVPASYREIQHAVLVNKVVGTITVLRVLQVTVVDAGVCEAPRQVGTCQGLMWHLWDGHLVAKLPHVLAEEVCVAYVE